MNGSMIPPAIAAFPSSEEYAKRLEEMRQAELEAAWARERRELWKSIVMNGAIGTAIRGEVPGEELRATADKALAWFDERFAGEFPLNVRVKP